MKQNLRSKVQISAELSKLPKKELIDILSSVIDLSTYDIIHSSSSADSYSSGWWASRYSLLILCLPKKIRTFLNVSSL